MSNARSPRGSSRATRNFRFCIFCRLARKECTRNPPGRLPCNYCQDKGLLCTPDQAADQSRDFVVDLMRERRERHSTRPENAPQGTPNFPAEASNVPNSQVLQPEQSYENFFGEIVDLDVSETSALQSSQPLHPLQLPQPFIDFGFLRTQYDYLKGLRDSLRGHNLDLSQPFNTIQSTIGILQAMMRGRFDEMSKMSFEANDSGVYGEGRAGEMYHRMLCGLDTLEEYPNRRKVLLKIARYYRQRGDEPEVLKTLERVVHPEPLSSTSADPDVWRMFSESIMKTTSSDTCASPYLNESTLPNNSCPIFHRSLQYRNHFVSQNFLPPNAANMPLLDIIRRHPIHAAADCGDAETVKHLVKVYPKAIDARDSFERTPIFVAASRGHEEVFEVLQQVGASLEVRNVLCHSIMQVAAQGGHVRIVGRLLQLGCSVNEQTLRKHGAYPPLHAAAGAGRFDVVHLLVRNNADITQKDVCLRTPEQFAREQGHDQLAAFLAEEAISNSRRSGLV